VISSFEPDDIQEVEVNGESIIEAEFQHGEGLEHASCIETIAKLVRIIVKVQMENDQLKQKLESINGFMKGISNG
jgi:hypothetical protein